MAGFRNRRKQLEREYFEGIDHTGGQGAAAEGEYLRRSMDFDAQDAVNASARAQFDEFREDLGRDITALRGSAVGAGRLDSGYLTEDEDFLIGEGIEDLNRSIAARSVDAAGLNLRATEGLGQFGLEQTGRSLDLVSGGLDRATAEENDRRNRRNALLGTLANVGGTVAGSFLGPVGAAGGAALANRLFGSK